MRKILVEDRSTLRIPSAADLSTAALPARYIGDSMGSIIGAGYATFSGYRFASFLVAGAPFTFLLTRSDLFAFYASLMDFQVYDRVDMRIVITTWQLLLDAAESSGWAHSGLFDKMNTLTEICLGDSTVTTVAGRIFGLNFNASQLVPVVEDIYGVQEGQGPIKATAGVHVINEGIFTDDASGLPTDNRIPRSKCLALILLKLYCRLPLAGTRVHYCLGDVHAVKQQMMEFLGNATFVNSCGSSCVYGSKSTC